MLTYLPVNDETKTPLSNCIVVVVVLFLLKQNIATHPYTQKYISDIGYQSLGGSHCNVMLTFIYKKKTLYQL